MKRILLFAAAIIVGSIVYSGMYVLDETQQAVITQFGKAIGKPITKAGLKFKLPVVQKLNSFPKNLLEWDGDPGQVPTKDKTFIWVDVFGRWRIVNALKYFEKVNNEQSAQSKLDDIIDAAVRNVITSNILIESVRNSNREMDFTDRDTSAGIDSTIRNIALGRGKMLEEILEQAQPKLAEFGIELVDVRFKRILYVDKVLRNIYDRMIAERKQIAEKYLSEGRGESSRIAGEKEKELKRIYSEAYKEAQTIKGDADGDAAAIYAAAYNRDPEFYSFIKTLELYQKSLDSTTWAVLTTKTDFLKYLKKYAPIR